MSDKEWNLRQRAGWVAFGLIDDNIVRTNDDKTLSRMTDVLEEFANDIYNAAIRAERSRAKETDQK